MNKKNIKIGHVNIRSLLPKINKIKNIMRDYKYYILAISETNRLSFKILESNDNIEQLWISVNIMNDDCIYGVVYRPHATE